MKKKFGNVRYIGIVVGIIVLLWFLLPLLVAGIVNIGNITGIAIALLFVLYMAYMSEINDRIKQLWSQKRMRFPMGICCAIVAVIMLLAVVETGCIISACAKAPKEDATVVVLGCRVYGERASLSLVERLEEAYSYLEEHPMAVCVVSGGKGNGENISEAECMYRWLVDKGIDSDRIYKEDKSTSTEENIAFSKVLIEKEGLSKEIAIVTSEYHCYRAGEIAQKADMSFGTVPGKTAIWLFPTFYVRELYAILAEWIF